MLFSSLTAVTTAITFNALISTLAPPNPSTGCLKPLPHSLILGRPSKNLTLNSTNGGGERSYLLHMPHHLSQASATPTPLLIALHAFGESATSMENMTRFSDHSINQNYIVTYPQGIDNMWMGNPLAPKDSYPDDRPFIIDIIDHLEDTFCIDKSRIYVTGFSNGGGLSGLLSCYPPALERVAAFSAIAGADYMTDSLPYTTMFELRRCKGSGEGRKVPFLEIHCTADMIIAYHGNNTRPEGVSGPSTVPVPEWLKGFAARNSRGPSLSGCVPYAQCYKFSGEDAHEEERKRRGSVEKTFWDCGAEKEVVVGYKVQGLGHGWPSTVPLDENLEGFRLGPMTWNASSTLLGWFSRFSLSRR